MIVLVLVLSLHLSPACTCRSNVPPPNQITGIEGRVGSELGAVRDGRVCLLPALISDELAGTQTSIDCVALPLLRRHVGWRANDAAGIRKTGGRFMKLGDAKVGQDGVAAFI